MARYGMKMDWIPQDERLSCVLCGKLVLDRQELNFHMCFWGAHVNFQLKFTRERPCPFCPPALAVQCTPEHLTVHQSPLSRFRCFQCILSFTNLHELRCHAQSVHDINNEEQEGRMPKLRCVAMCGQYRDEAFVSKSLYNYHCIMEHGFDLHGKSHPLRCHICLDLFSTVKELCLHTFFRHPNSMQRLASSAITTYKSVKEPKEERRTPGPAGTKKSALRLVSSDEQVMCRTCDSVCRPQPRCDGKNWYWICSNAKCTRSNGRVNEPERLVYEPIYKKRKERQPASPVVRKTTTSTPKPPPPDVVARSRRPPVQVLAPRRHQPLSPTKERLVLAESDLLEAALASSNLDNLNAELTEVTEEASGRWHSAQMPNGAQYHWKVDYDQQQEEDEEHVRVI